MSSDGICGFIFAQTDINALQMQESSIIIFGNL